MEEDIIQAHSLSTKSDNTLQILADKVDNLENRSRRNNLRPIGMPETVKPSELHKICEETLPKALGIYRKIVVRRAHCIGAPQPDRRGP